MLPFGVTNPATVLQRSEIPEGLTNCPVYNVYYVYVYVDTYCVLSTRIFVYGDLKFSREFSGLYHVMGGYQRYERTGFLSFRVKVIKFADKKQVLKFLDPYQITRCHN